MSREGRSLSNPHLRRNRLLRPALSLFLALLVCLFACFIHKAIISRVDLDFLNFFNLRSITAIGESA